MPIQLGMCCIYTETCRCCGTLHISQYGYVDYVNRAEAGGNGRDMELVELDVTFECAQCPC